MAIKFLGTRSEHFDEVQFGTCEMCMYTAPDTDTYFQFEVDGKEIEVDGFSWSWGDKFEIWIENLPNFMYWFNNTEHGNYIEPDEFGYVYGWLQNVVYRYEDWLYEEGEA